MDESIVSEVSDMGYAAQSPDHQPVGALRHAQLRHAQPCASLTSLLFFVLTAEDR